LLAVANKLSTSRPNVVWAIARVVSDKPQIAKTRLLGYTFVADSMDLTSVNVKQLVLKFAVLCGITRNDGQWVLKVNQSHRYWYWSKANIDFLLVNNTNLCHISIVSEL